MSPIVDRAVRSVLGVLVAIGALGALVAPTSDPETLIAAHQEEEILDSARDLTREQEGLIPYPYQPTAGSGITICHGYDMKQKTRTAVEADLRRVEPSIDEPWVERLAGGAGLRGGADRFMEETSDIALTAEQCASLFEVTYAAEADVAEAFATEPDEYGPLGVDYPSADWEALDPAIKGIVIDLKFRGDYRPWWEAQAELQEAIAADDASAVLEQVRRVEIFPADLPPARYQARVEWLEGVLGAGWMGKSIDAVA